MDIPVIDLLQGQSALLGDIGNGVRGGAQLQLRRPCLRRLCIGSGGYVFDDAFFRFRHDIQRILPLPGLAFQLLKHFHIHKAQQTDNAAQKDHDHQQQSDQTAVTFGRMCSAGAVDAVVPGFGGVVFVFVHSGYLN